MLSRHKADIVEYLQAAPAERASCAPDTPPPPPAPYPYYPHSGERLYQAMWQKGRQTTYRAIGAMDIALWDIAGKVTGQPIHRLLGSYRQSVPAYASSAVLPSKEAYAEEAARFKSAGWTAYKIHPPTDPVVDAEVCRAVRRSVGDAFTVMLDSTWAYQYPEALRVGKVIEELGFYWYEDPLADQRARDSEVRPRGTVRARGRSPVSHCRSGSDLVVPRHLRVRLGLGPIRAKRRGTRRSLSRRTVCGKSRLHRAVPERSNPHD
jgi:hypothetical protein